MLIFGGSQGAAFFAKTLLEALCLLPLEKRLRLDLSIQLRPEDIATSKAVLEQAQIKATVRPFFDDMPQQFTKAHLIICRSGASSIAEIAAAGRPAGFIPFPYAIDNHQHKNALSLSEQQAGWLWAQENTTCQDYCTKIEHLMDNPDELAQAAMNASASGLHKDAPQLLGQLITSLIKTA